MLNSYIQNPISVCKQMIYIKLDRKTWLIELTMLNSNTWNHLTVYKKND